MSIENGSIYLGPVVDTAIAMTTTGGNSIRKPGMLRDIGERFVDQRAAHGIDLYESRAK